MRRRSDVYWAGSHYIFSLSFVRKRAAGLSLGDVEKVVVASTREFGDLFGTRPSDIRI